MATQAISNERFFAGEPARSKSAAVSRRSLWAGRIVSALPAVFLLMDGAMKLWKPPIVVESTIQLGFPETTIVGIGLALLASTALYLVPRTAVLGAILLTGYLGGAIASKVRVQAPLFDIVFAIVFAVFLWGGLWLRDRRVQELLPLTSR